MAYVGDAVPAARLATTMGPYVAGTATGGMTGRIGIGFLAETFGWRVGLLGLTALGLIFGCYAFGVLSSSLSGGWVNRWGAVRVLYVSCAVTAVGVLVSVSEQLGVFIAGMALMTAGFFALHAVCSGWVGKEAGPHKAQATGLYLLSYYIGSSTAGYGGGWLWMHGGWALLCVGLLVGVAVFVWVVAGLAHTLRQAPPHGSLPLTSSPKSNDWRTTQGGRACQRQVSSSKVRVSTSSVR